MKIRAERKALLAGISRVQGVVERRNTMPILSHLLMQTTDRGPHEQVHGVQERGPHEQVHGVQERGPHEQVYGVQEEGVSFFATDLEIGIRTACQATVEAPGQVALPARRFFDLIREMPEGTIEIRAEDNHWVAIESSTSRYRIVGLPPEEFPALTSPDANLRVVIPAATLSGFIQRVQFAATDHNTRPILTGILLETVQSKQTLCLVATDGHRLALAEGSLQAGSISPLSLTLQTTDCTQVVVPKKTLLEIRGALDEVAGDRDPELLIGKKQIAFKWGNYQLISRVLDGTYPNYRSVIPSDSVEKGTIPTRVTVSRKDMEGGLKRVSILSKDGKVSPVWLQQDTEKGLPACIYMRTSNADVGEATEEVAARIEHGGTGPQDTDTLKLNARYLLEVLSVLQLEDVTLELRGPKAPCVIRELSSGFLTIIMPIE